MMSLFMRMTFNNRAGVLERKNEGLLRERIRISFRRVATEGII